MGTVTKLVTQNTSARVPLDQMRKTISREVREARMSGAKLKDMAADAKLNPSTVSKLASEDTKYPRFSTVAAVMGVLGYRIIAERD